MQFKQELNALSSIDTDMAVLFVFQDQQIDAVIKSLDDKVSNTFIEQVVKAANSENFKGKSMQTLKLPTFGHIKANWLMLVGVGKLNDRKDDVVLPAADCVCETAEKPYTYKGLAMRTLAAKTCRSVVSSEGVKRICFVLPYADDHIIRLLVEGWLLASYSFDKYKTKAEDKKKKGAESVSILCKESNLDQAEFEDIVSQAEIIAEATNFARDLIAEPPISMTPTKLAEMARSIAGGDVSCEIMDKAAIENLKMGAFLGVARGAGEPPKFIVLKYAGKKSLKAIAIVGKGITFDSGGLSLKGAQAMENMKYDMAGAAVVLAVMKAVSKLKLPVTLTAVVGATENMPGSFALHPGDVIVASNGKTIEVNNTDAEGRLVLADALSYVAKEKPDEIIDVATLTGAVITALGKTCAGIMGNNKALIRNLIGAGRAAGEKYWQLPMFEEYQDSLKSDIADLKNAGAKGEAPTACAAMFLKEFVNGRPWAHLDIAGPAWSDREQNEMNKGGTAFGVRTLCYYLMSLKEK